MRSLVKFTGMALVVLSLTACGGYKPLAANTAQKDTLEAGSQEIYGLGEHENFEDNYNSETNPDSSAFKETRNEKELLGQRAVHFGFDKSEILPLDKEILAAHARYLLDHPNLMVVVQGHTDERGSSEYNVALGERRAQAVARILYALGLPKNRVTLVSYGEEKPVDFHHNETAWSKNRRAEIVYS